MTLRLVRKAGPVAGTAKPRGIMVGWLVGSQVDTILGAALPRDWAIVTDPTAPLNPTFDTIRQARALAGVDATVPVLLVGWSAGCQTVRNLLLSNVLPKDQIAGVAVFDGTSSSWPKINPAHVRLWADLATEARKGGVPFVATATEMVYTKDLKDDPRTVKVEAPFAPTSYVLEAALGVTLEVAHPIIEGNLYVELHPSPKDASPPAAAAHVREVNVHLPLLLNFMFGDRSWAAPTEPAPEVVTPEPAGPAPTPAEVPASSLTPRQRLLAWYLKELADGVAEVPLGSNAGPRVDDYAALPYTRRDPKTGKEKALGKLTGAAWCAMMFSYGVFAVGAEAWPWFTPRVSGAELRADAERVGRWHSAADVRAGKYVPQPGDYAQFKRKGEAWETHSTIVETWSLSGAVTTIGGNEGLGKVQRTDRKMSAPEFLGVVDMS